MSCAKRFFLCLGVFCLLLVWPERGFAWDNQEEDEEYEWTLTAGGRYMSKFTKFGRDLGQDQPAILLDGGISHTSGLSLGTDATHVLNIGGQFQQSSLFLGYEFPISDNFTFSAEFSRYFYTNDSLNALAAFSSSLSIGADVNAGNANLSVTFERYFGDGRANQVVVGLSSYAQVGDLSIVPVIQASFVTQSVSNIFLKSNKEKKGGISAGTANVAELSSIAAILSLGYPLGHGFRLLLTPAYIYAPTELAARTSQFIWTVGISYSLDF